MINLKKCGPELANINDVRIRRCKILKFAIGYREVAVFQSGTDEGNIDLSYTDLFSDNDILENKLNSGTTADVPYNKASIHCFVDGTARIDRN